MHFAVLEDHLHLIVEADDARSLSRGSSGLKVRIAKGLNKLFSRTGAVFSQRYHVHVLRTPQEVRNGIRYVLLNFAKHRLENGFARPLALFDPCSSARSFDGWTVDVARHGDAHGEREDAVAQASTWLLRTGWRRHGLISPDEIPVAPQNERSRSSRGRKTARTTHVPARRASPELNTPLALRRS